MSANPDFKDIDIWINPTKENASRVWKALEQFGAPLESVSPGDFTSPELIYQIGIEPNRIDILMNVAGVDFNSSYKNSIESSYGGVPVRILSKSDVIAAKRSIGRKQDLLDLERLEDEKDSPD